LSIKTIKNVVMKIAKRFQETQITWYAAQSSFFVIFSAIPFIMLLFMIIDRFLPLTTEEMLDALVSFFPSAEFVIDFMDELPSHVTEGLFEVDAPTVSFTLIAVLWSASKGVNAVSLGVRAVYGVSYKPGEFFTRIARRIFYTVGFLITLVFMLVILVFGNLLNQKITNYNAQIGEVVRFIFYFRGIISILLLSLFFTLIYKLNGNRNVKFMGHLPGAIFAACGWVIFSFGFSIYVDYFSNYSYLYGSLGLIILLMLWIYTCMVILLVGAELNVYMQKHPVIIV